MERVCGNKQGRKIRIFHEVGSLFLFYRVNIVTVLRKMLANK